MVYSSYTKLRILRYHSQGYKPYTIAKLLCESDGIRVSRYGIAKFLKVYHATGSIRRRPGSGRISKITAEIKELVEQQMQQDDEIMAYELHRMINESSYDVSLQTVLRCRTFLGWTFRGSAYCQLIRDADIQHPDDDFEDIIWTDECMVQLQNHRRFCCRKLGQWPRPNSR